MTAAGPTSPKRLHVARAVAAAVLATGLALLVLMVTTEGEPGLLPLVLVLGGAIALGVTHTRILRRRRAGG